MKNTHTHVAAVVAELTAAVNAGTLTAAQAATMCNGILGDNVRVEGIHTPRLDEVAKPEPKRTRKRAPKGLPVAKLRAAIAVASEAKGGCVRALGGSFAKQDHGRILDALGLEHTAEDSARVNAGIVRVVEAGGEWSHVDAKLRLHKAKSAKTTKAHAEELIARATKRVDEYRAG